MAVGSIVSDINEVIRLRGLEHRVDSGNNNIILKICPVCGDSDYHFYLGTSTDNLGLYNCFKCGGRSVGDTSVNNWDKLRKIILGDEELIISPLKQNHHSKNLNQYIENVKVFHEALFKDEEALSYLLKERNISVDMIKFFKLGLRKIHSQTADQTGLIKFICIPHFFKHNLANAKFRALPPAPREFIRIRGSESVLFNYDNIDMSKDYIYICEGELDAISLYQAGEKNIVSITAGAQSFLPEWYDLLRDFKIVYIVFDNDLKGQEGAISISKRLGQERCYNILLPSEEGTVKDLNDYFKKFDISDFKSLTLKATKFTMETIYSMETLLLKMERRIKDSGVLIEGIETPWKTLNTKMGPIAKGDLIFLSGRPKCAKTTFALNLCYHFSKTLNLPSLLFCLEMPPERLTAKLIALHRKVPTDRVSLEDILLTRTELVYNDVPLYFGYTADPNTLRLDTFFKLLETIKKKYGIEFLVFDNIQFLSRDREHTPQEVALISRQFKLMAMNFDMRIMPIVQPRRMADDEMMTSSHMKDSSAMEADGDVVLICHRKSRVTDKILTGRKQDDENLLSPIVTVTVDRCRYSVGGYAKLYLEGDKSFIREATESEVIND